MGQLSNEKATGAQRGINDQLDMLGIRLSIEAQLGARDDDTALVRLRIGPSQGVPLHTHESECIYVLDGKLEVFILNDQPRWQALEVGQSVVVPADVKHAIRNASDKPTDVLALTSVRLARFFSEVSTPAGGAEPNSPLATDLELFVRKASEYSYWLASPEESAAITG